MVSWSLGAIITSSCRNHNFFLLDFFSVHLSFFCSVIQNYLYFLAEESRYLIYFQCCCFALNLLDQDFLRPCVSNVLLFLSFRRDWNGSWSHEQLNVLYFHFYHLDFVLAALGGNYDNHRYYYDCGLFHDHQLLYRDGHQFKCEELCFMRHFIYQIHWWSDHHSRLHDEISQLRISHSYVEL